STSVPGVLDREGKVVAEIAVIDKDVLSLAKKEKSAVGLGGMTSKLNFARLANRMGIQAVIFSMQTPDGILSAVKGETGTICLPLIKKVPSRCKWLASGSLVKSSFKRDERAVRAMQNRKRLLAVGILVGIQPLETGEVFHIANEIGEVFAVA